MDKAVDMRETGELDKSRKLFESLVKEVSVLLRRNSTDKLKNLYIQVMDEYVIQHRLEAKKSYNKALDFGKKLLEFDKKYNIHNPSSYRSVSNVLINLGSFEESVGYLKKVVDLYKGNSGRQGDALSHLAYCYLRSGNVVKADELINDALKKIKKNTKNEKYVSVWLSRALMFRSYILFAQGDIKEALKHSKRALKVAEENKLPIRIKQGKDLVNFLQSEVHIGSF